MSLVANKTERLIIVSGANGPVKLVPASQTEFPDEARNNLEVKAMFEAGELEDVKVEQSELEPKPVLPKPTPKVAEKKS